MAGVRTVTCSAEPYELDASRSTHRDGCLTGIHTSITQFTHDTGLQTCGVHTEGVTPVPIPNTAVKPFEADGTREEPWESRSTPHVCSTV